MPKKGGSWGRLRLVTEAPTLLEQGQQDTAGLGQAGGEGCPVGRRVGPALSPWASRAAAGSVLMNTGMFEVGIQGAGREVADNELIGK